MKVGGKVPDDATPGITFGNGITFLAWIRKANNKLALKPSTNGGLSWENEKTLGYKSRNHGSAALAFGNGTLFLSWVGKSEQYIHIATLRPDADGRLTLMREEKLNVRCKKTPVLLFLTEITSSFSRGWGVVNRSST